MQSLLVLSYLWLLLQQAYSISAETTPTSPAAAAATSSKADWTDCLYPVPGGQALQPDAQLFSWVDTSPYSAVDANGSPMPIQSPTGNFMKPNLEDFKGIEKTINEAKTYFKDKKDIKCWSPSIASTIPVDSVTLNKRYRYSAVVYCHNQYSIRVVNFRSAKNPPVGVTGNFNAEIKCQADALEIASQTYTCLNPQNPLNKDKSVAFQFGPRMDTERPHTDNQFYRAIAYSHYGKDYSWQIMLGFEKKGCPEFNAIEGKQASTMTSGASAVSNTEAASAVPTGASSAATNTASGS